MRQDIIIAGVGGQGILTIARVLSMAAITKGLNVKQAEVHGMSQRGGAVYSHLRLSDTEIFSDLIPAGMADIILAIEPLEALRYVPMLRQGGIVVASTNADVNVGDYPPIEQVLDHITRFHNHVAVDMEKLARAAGGVLAANIVALGVASLYLVFTTTELETAIEALFTSKGERVVGFNIRAFRFGRAAATGYIEAIQRGAEPSTIRNWISTLSAVDLDSDTGLDFEGLDIPAVTGELTAAESHAFEGLLMGAFEEGRKQLYEHEVYRLIELVGAISPPKHTFIPKGSSISMEMLQSFPSDRVVVKLVSPDVVHKTESGAVSIVSNDLGIVRAEIERLVSVHSKNSNVAGTIVVEFVDHNSGGLGSELFVGIRATREFGPVIAAGLGGLHTEYLAAKMLPGVAVAKALALDTDAQEFCELFKKTAAYDLLSGNARGTERLVSDAALIQCFRAFISIARRFCVDRGEEGPDIGELEVNPFAFVGQRLVPLDGRARLHPAAKASAARPLDRVQSLLEPRSIALIGVSSKQEGFGRLILANTLKSGFDRDRITIIKAGQSELDGILCVPSISDLAEPNDLLVITAPAKDLPSIIDESNTSRKVRSGIMISGGAGETDDELGDEILRAILRGREHDGAVFLGPNCMGVQSKPGRYDTFFIPESKLPPKTNLDTQPLAIVSQSGAFIVSRLSSLENLCPAFTISIGNQSDITVSDILSALSAKPEVRVVGIYMEGFSNLDGLETVRAISRWTGQGKSAIFYKGGRTDSGRSAAAGHTAAVAGDYDICQTAMQQAGAMVAKTFREFSQLVEMSTALVHKIPGNGRIFAITNAGMEAVAIADALAPGATLAPMSERFEAALADVLVKHRLDKLVGLRNPLDLTPMANEAVYDEIVSLALAQDDFDAIIVSCVPLAPCLHTLAAELADPGSFAAFASQWTGASKPVVFVADAGREFDALAQSMRTAGLAVFNSADEAMAALTTWIQNHVATIPAILRDRAAQPPRTHQFRYSDRKLGQRAEL